MLGLAFAAPVRYREFVQEDRFIEWWTVFLFLAAAIPLARRAIAQRRIFDLLIAAFCVFVAGEEFSWGQRLLGFTPPDLFLQHNTQQEFTLHNFADLFGQPKGVLMLALGGYGVVLPLLARVPGAARLLEHMGASSPHLSVTPWFLAAVLLLYFYPVEFTGEWVEAMAGGLFLASTRPSPRALSLGVLTTAAAAAALTFISARAAQGSPAALACARQETAALAADLPGAATQKLINVPGSVHKRIWTAIQDRYLYPHRFAHFQKIACATAPHYFIDPWGLAYWLRVVPMDNGALQITVYSMGPNRRRDHDPDQKPGDDIIATAVRHDPR